MTIKGLEKDRRFEKSPRWLHGIQVYKASKQAFLHEDKSTTDHGRLPRHRLFLPGTNAGPASRLPVIWRILEKKLAL